MTDTSRHARAAISEELKPYKHLGATVIFTRDGDKIRTVLGWRGKQRAVYFSCHATKPHAINSVLSDVRREMRNLGIINRDKPIGALGEVLIDAVRKHHPVAVRPPPPPEPEDDDPLCPDAIAATASIAKETRPMSNITRLPAVETADLPAVETAEIKSNGAADPASDTKRSSLTDKEFGTLLKLLLRHGDSEARGDGVDMYTYHENWSDERALTELQTAHPTTRAQLHTIVRKRREQCGHLASEHKPRVAKADYAGRIDALEAEVGSLKAALAALERRLAAAEKVTTELAA